MYYIYSIDHLVYSIRHIITIYHTYIIMYTLCCGGTLFALALQSTASVRTIIATPTINNDVAITSAAATARQQ